MAAGRSASPTQDRRPLLFHAGERWRRLPGGRPTRRCRPYASPHVPRPGRTGCQAAARRGAGRRGRPRYRVTAVVESGSSSSSMSTGRSFGRMAAMGGYQAHRRRGTSARTLSLVWTATRIRRPGSAGLRRDKRPGTSGERALKSSGDEVVTSRCTFDRAVPDRRGGRRPTRPGAASTSPTTSTGEQVVLVDDTHLDRLLQTAPWTAGGSGVVQASGVERTDDGARVSTR